MSVWRLILLIVYLSSVSPAITQESSPDAYVMRGSAQAEQVFGHVSGLEDPSRALTVGEVLMPSRGSEWRPVGSDNADFGYTNSVIWLRLRVQNASENEDWRLHIHENFFQIFEAYLRGTDGEIQVLEQLGETSPFSDRDIDHPTMTAGFTLTQGETAELIVRYWSGGSSEISFSLYTAREFEQFAARRVAKDFIFYGMMLILALAAVVAWAATGRHVFFAYALYASFGLLFIMHGDGNSFQYLWPNAPLFNGYASILLGSGLIVSGANFARQFLQTAQYHPVVDRLLLVVMGLPFVTILASIVVDHQIIKQALVPLATCAVLLFVAAGLNAARTRFREVRFFVIAWVGAVLSSAMMTARHMFGIDIPEEVQFDSMRIVFVLDAALMGIAIIDRFDMIRRAQREMLETLLGEAQRNLSLTNRLRNLEEQYGAVAELARVQRHNLADAVHDLRQPLQALRLNVRELTRGGQGDRSQVEETLQYLENLVNRELAAHVMPGNDLATDRQDAQPTDIAAVLKTVGEMFARDAAAKGVALSHVPTSAQTALAPLTLMRIVSNLVGNAVKYTESGRVLFGVRHGAPGLRIEVHDTGPGLAQEDLKAAMARSVQLESDAEPDGYGLGLAIVEDLVRQHGLEIGLCRGRRTGTGIYVTMPPAKLG